MFSRYVKFICDEKDKIKLKWGPVIAGSHTVLYLSRTPAKNNAKCDSWVKILHISIFDILFECTVDFKIKGDNSVIDTQIQ